MKTLMKAVVVLLFAISAISAKGQFVEKKYLKDNIIFDTGQVVEKAAQDFIKILRVNERDTVVVNRDKILKGGCFINEKTNKELPQIPHNGRQQALFLELGGAGFWYSLNYDFRLHKGRRDKWGLRFGISAFGGDITMEPDGKIGRITLISLPIQMNYIVGSRRSALELGAGVTSLFAAGKINSSEGIYYFENFKKRASDFYPCVNALIGYRFTSLNNGLIFRLTYNPTIVYGEFISTVGLSVGYHQWNKK